MRLRTPTLTTVAVLLMVGPLAAAPGADVNTISDDVFGVDETDSPRRNQPETALSINSTELRHHRGRGPGLSAGPGDLHGSPDRP